MNVAVVIPFGGSDPYRAKALQRVLDYYRAEFPVWPVTVGLDRSPVFSRSRAINNGAERSDSELLVVNDADTLVPAGQLRQAVELATAEPGIVRAYIRYRRLSKEYTDDCHQLCSYQSILAAPDWAVEWQQDPAYAHGALAVQRACFDMVGGYDPRFEGWGYEDMAVELLYDAHWPDRRVPGDLFHCWHPGGQTNDVYEQRNMQRYYGLYEPRRGDPAGLLRARMENR